ncbi:MAG: PDZ domain-containing protein, partial [Planctomycetes bacterium]|nr:PDZ domain-containing protein [Planctomycetota bacterium]
MKIAFACAVAIVAMLAFSSNIPNAEPTGLAVNQAETLADTVANADQFPDFTFSDNKLGKEARDFLFDINRGGSAPQLMQRGGSLPEGWTTEDPLDLTGEMPSDSDVRAAIVKAIDSLLSKQNENGSWDVVLEGTLLSETADEAVDAIAATALAGIAMRYHMAVNPAKLKVATAKAADFRIDRVYRGKLPLSVQYANWRYTLGLKFLHLEYMASESDERKSEIRSVCRRMVQAMMKLQLSNSEAGTLEKKRKKKVSSRFRGMDQPCQLGVVLELPTDDNYRGGAPIAEIIPGTTAEEQGFRVGDRIIEAEGLRVENAVDFYMMEPGWVAGQRVAIKLRRKGSKDTTKNIQLDPSWPAIIGIKGETVSTGVQVTGFYPFSEAKDELEIGDIIFAVNRVPVANLDDISEFESGLTMGDKVKVEVYRGAKRRKKKESFKVGAAPEGWTGILPKSEDKGDGNGVYVRENPVEGSLAFELGIKEGDRVTRIGNLPLLGFDHFVEAYLTIPAARKLKITWVRDGEEMSGSGFPEPIIQPGDLQLTWILNQRNDFVRPPRVESVLEGGVAQKGKIEKGDILTAINGTEIQVLIQALQIFNRFAAGEEVELTFQRNSTSYTVTIELAKVKETADVGNEEGGWAYYPSMMESPSFSTAAGMLALMNIESDLDIRGLRSALKDPLMSAARLVNSLRAPDSSGLSGKSETYAYRAGSINPKKKTVDMRGAQGR